MLQDFPKSGSRGVSIVRVDKIEAVRADCVSRVDPEDPLCRWTYVEEGRVLVEFDKDVGAVLHKGTKPLLVLW